MSNAQQTQAELLKRFGELDSALRGLALGGAELPPELVEERDSLERELKAGGVDAGRMGADPFATLDDDGPVASVISVKVPSQSD